MYQKLKKVAFQVLPKAFIVKHEKTIRSALAILYSGTKHRCEVCEENLSAFVEAPTGALCPVCGSLGRTRFLSRLLSKSFSDTRMNVLHFSPHKKLSENLKKRYSNYCSSDFEKTNCDYQMDIQNLGFPDNSFDLIICFHVLEHIPDDRKAMKELIRVLACTGSVLIQVPFREGETLEDPSIKSPEERLKLFGQEDHLRWYSSTDLIQRLEASGFICKTTRPKDTIDPKQLNFLGIEENQLIVIATKP